MTDDALDLLGLLADYKESWGYAVGMKKIPGFLPGAKSFPPFVRQFQDGTKLSCVDTYFGKRDSGGIKVISHNDIPVLIIQYRGGEPWYYVHDSQVAQITAFLKEAIKTPEARLPGVRQPTLLFENDEFAYFGFGRGDIWNLRWVEIVVRKYDEESFSRLKKTIAERGVEIFDRIVLELHAGIEIVFYHIIDHQRIG